MATVGYMCQDGSGQSTHPKNRMLVLPFVMPGEVPMSELPDYDDAQIVGRVIITRVLAGDDILDHVIAQDVAGYELGLADALGMMRLAEDTLIRSRTVESDDGE